MNGASTLRDDGIRLDIAVDGFWGASREREYLDIRVFNPFAVSTRHQSLSSMYRAQKNEKKRQCSERVREVEHASFTPLVLSATGGWAREASVFYKRLASLLADKWYQPYSSTMNWLKYTCWRQNAIK